MGNPTYSTTVPISEPFYSDLEPEQPQPVYQELEREQVYMDPNATPGVQSGQQEQPVYRELYEAGAAGEVPGSPIYREIDEPPMYAETNDTAGRPTMNGEEPRQYQELNYASTENEYHPLSKDWKSQKYNE